MSDTCHIFAPLQVAQHRSRLSVPFVFKCECTSNTYLYYETNLPQQLYVSMNYRYSYFSLKVLLCYSIKKQLVALSLSCLLALLNDAIIPVLLSVATKAESFKTMIWYEFIVSRQEQFDTFSIWWVLQVSSIFRVFI